jgi:hypothetical protein
MIIKISTGGDQLSGKQTEPNGDNLLKSQKDLTTALKTLETVERDHIVRMLEQTQWNVIGKNMRLKSLGSTAAPCALVCVNLTFKNHKFSSQWSDLQLQIRCSSSI